MDRRSFIVRATGAGGMLVGFSIPGVRAVAAVATSAPTPAATVTTPMSAWITIDSTGAVAIRVGSAEMGQGVLTALPQIVAEELMIDWANITTVHSPAGAQWGNPAYGGMQVTGGSSSVRGYYDAMRVAGATVRDMLVQAAANYWGVSASTCNANHGIVTHVPTARTRSYGALAAAAALLPPPTNPTLTDPASFRLIGTSVPRTDVPQKVTGKAVFGTDVKLAGMVCAAVRHCPTIGGTTATIGATPAGTLGVVDLGNAVAVVATRWRTAFSAVSTLPVTWNLPTDTSGCDSATLSTRARQLMTTPTSPPAVAETSGNAAGAIAGAPTKISATYSVPFVAHAVLEPVNLTTLVTPTSCTMWGSVQNQTATVATAAALTGLDPSQVTLNTTLLGGGLGRKLETDYVAQSVRIAMQFPGKPVKLIWPRREDFAYDKFRPMALMKVQAGANAAGSIVGWRNRIVTPSILAQKGYPFGAVDGQAVEGATGLPYALGARLVEWVDLPTTVPMGFLRSVGSSFNAFAIESAMDELAAAAHVDPVQFRLNALAGKPRHQAVVQAAADLAGWGSAPAGRAHGIAFHESFGSLVAQVAEVSQPSPGQIRVHRVVCALDCGLVVNPDIVRAQIEGGIVLGLNLGLYSRISFKNGVPSPTNFDKYRTLRMRDMPVIDVTMLQSGGPLGGVGEVGVPPTAPAVANAWFALTGQRKRSLPMF